MRQVYQFAAFAVVLSLALFAFGVAAQTPAATPARRVGHTVVTFTVSKPAGSVYTVEQRQLLTWKTVATGPSSPLAFDIPNPAGTYTFRVRAQITSVKPPVSVVSATKTYMVRNFGPFTPSP